MKDGLVVSYRNSTSNHNSRYYKYFLFQLYLIEILHQTTTGKCIECRQKKLYLIEILHQTTTQPRCEDRHQELYLIEILHQTTTLNWNVVYRYRLYLIEILHQTTTSRTPRSHSLGLYLIEILHQTTTVFDVRISLPPLYLIEILHQTTTISVKRRARTTLYLIEILHQTTTLDQFPFPEFGCILSKFYIKPQHSFDRLFLFCVVSYRNSTSNHNLWTTKSASEMLYLIEILHQTTTIKTPSSNGVGCILSKFYIKPQPRS